MSKRQLKIDLARRTRERFMQVVRDTLDLYEMAGLEHEDAAVPVIQREFVWRPEQIERLFDSLMQGYPIGTFLFWKVEAATSSKFHQRNAPPI